MLSESMFILFHRNGADQKILLYRLVMDAYFVYKQLEELVKSFGQKSAIKQDQDSVKVAGPFFSTKRGGTGLGLAIVKKIVGAHSGEVFFHPNPERGVTFVVRLPILTPPDSH